MKRKRQWAVAGMRQDCRAIVEAGNAAVYVNVGEGEVNPMIDHPGNTTVMLDPIVARRLAGHLLDAAEVAERSPS